MHIIKMMISNKSMSSQKNIILDTEKQAYKNFTFVSELILNE